MDGKCGSSLDEEITNAIKIMRSNSSFITTRTKDKKPSLEEIYNFIKDKLQIISEDQFLESFHRLEDNGIIYKREGNKYYFVNDESKILDDDVIVENEQDTNSSASYLDDKNIIEMIKGNMTQERNHNREYINFLKNEIEFYKSELRSKNIIITTLLASNVKVNVVKTSQCYQDDQSKYEISSQTTNDQHNPDNEFANDLRFNKLNSKGIDDKNKHDRNIIAEQRKTKEAKNIPTIEVIGDSHLNAINPRGLSNKNNVIVRNHPGSTTEDLTSFIVPTIKKKRDAIIIHCGANDLTNDTNTIPNLQTIVNRIKSKSANTKIAISSVFIRKDKKDIEQKVKGLNIKLKSFCEENLIDYLCNDNVDETCLGVKKLHLSKKGSAIFAQNLINYMKKLY